MSEKPNPDEIKAESGDLRGQLVKRLAVAGALVAILLGVLAVFDRLVTNPEEAEAPVFSRPVPVPPKKVLTQPVTPVPALPEPEPEVQAPPPPQVAEQPVLLPEEKPKAQPESRPVGNPALPKVTGSRPAKSITPTEKAVPPAIAESTAAPAITEAKALLPGPASAQTPTLALSPAVRANEPAAPTVRRLFSGFVVQAGVFSSAKRAEELQAQLQLGGVPATLETRVQVGPFKTRQEAEAAQEMLKKMGVESLLVPPKGARN